MSNEHSNSDEADASKTNIEYTVVYDTFCGWSYGAAAVLRALASSGARVEVIHRHLFEGDNAPLLAEGYGSRMEVFDARIASLTGVEYSDRYASDVRGSTTEVLESGLSADAATLVRERGPADELELSRRLQQRRFVDGVSGQNREDVIDVLVDFGVERQLAERIGQPELRAETRAQAERAREAMAAAGAVGVPAVIAHRADGDQVIDLASFYDDPEAAVAALIAEERA